MPWRSKRPLLTSYTRRVLFVEIGKAGKSVENSVTDNGLTITMKNVSQHTFDLAEDCICWQYCCMDHKTYEMMTSIEVVDNLVLSICFFHYLPRLRNCSYVDHDLAYRNNWETKTQYAGDEDISLSLSLSLYLSLSPIFT